MAVISFDEIHTGRDAEDEVDRRRGVRRYTRVFRVVTSTPYDEGSVVLAYGPGIGSVYGPEDMFAFCRRRKATNESFSKRIWIATYLYSTEFEPQEDPLQDPAEITWETEWYEVPVWKDINGKCPTNSAGYPYDDPVLMKDGSRLTVTVRKNVANPPAWILSWSDCLNLYDFTIDGLAVSAECAKIHRVSISGVQTRNDIMYRVLTLAIAIRPSKIILPGVEEAWMLTPEDTSFYQININNPSKRIPTIMDDGTYPTKPLPLDGIGFQLADPSPDNIVFRHFDVYEKKNFGALQVYFV